MDPVSHPLLADFAPAQIHDAAVRISRGKVRNRKPWPRDAGIEAADEFLAKRSRHPAAASSVRKLQRAFRIAGRQFAIINPKAGRRA